MKTKKVAILGVGAFGHDTSACLVDRESANVLFALAEERLSNKKHDAHFPVGAIAECRRVAERLGYEIGEVALNHRPVEFHAFLIEQIKELAADEGRAIALIRFLGNLPLSAYYVPGERASAHIDAAIGDTVDDRAKRSALCRRFSWYYNWSVKHARIAEECHRHFRDIPLSTFNHHLCHAEAAFAGGGWEDCAILVIDGQGEVDTTSVYRGSRGEMRPLQKSKWPFSLGVFYLAATRHLGFRLGDEYKVMGMAAYGTPTFLSRLAPAFHVSRDGRLSISETEYVAFRELPGTGHIEVAFTKPFRKLLPRHRSREELRQAHFDFAASVQALTECMGVSLASAALRLTGARYLALAGGVALNGLMNERIRREAGFDDVFIYPASGDDGTSVGAALAARRAWRGEAANLGRLATCFYGGQYDDAIAATLENASVRYEQPLDINEAMAEAVAAGKIVARFNGRSEFGPRALGNRSILADPRKADMRDVLNTRIKQRESFRPFAPACLAEHVSTYFDGAPDAPFMLLISKVRGRAYADIPAVVHQDGTARVQSVDRKANPFFHDTISAFYRRTGVPVLINTSFNVNGEAIVETALDAIESFCFMDIDYLAIGPYWVDRRMNRHVLEPLTLSDFLKRRMDRFEMNYAPSGLAMDIGSFDKAFFPVRPARARRLLGKLGAIFGVTERRW